MKLTTVTLTGADDSVQNHYVLQDISRAFPFVEWGILVSESSVGNVRFPSDDWIDRLCKVEGLRLSVHVCGRWVREICAGNWAPFLDRRAELFNRAERVQLNFHAEIHTLGAEFLGADWKAQDKQVIFQMDRVNDGILGTARATGIDAVPLFDASGGAGLTPKEWPAPIAGISNGYAGGLGPDNIHTEIERVSQVCSPDTKVWVDMETKLYSGDVFDLEKCARILKETEGYI